MRFSSSLRTVSSDVLSSSRAVARSRPSALSCCSSRASSSSTLAGATVIFCRFRKIVRSLVLISESTASSIHLFAILVRRNRVTAQEVDHLSLGDLLLGVFIDDRAKTSLAPGIAGARPAGTRAVGPAGAVGSVWARTAPVPGSAPRSILTTVQPGLSCASNRSPSRVWSLSITPEIHGWDVTRSTIYRARATGGTTSIDYTVFAQSRRGVSR